LVSSNTRAPWKRRLTLPAYQVKDAAKYAEVTPQTVRNWQHAATDAAPAIATRESGASLSYLQLQELAVVSAMRAQGVKLHKIRLAREWLSQYFQLEFPFSDARVKADGQDILVEELGRELGKTTVRLLVANKGGQYVWADVIRHRFGDFEYEGNLALRWHVRGRTTGVVIDPRVSFGAPTIRGVPTWAIRGRFLSGESIEDLSSDFVLTRANVMKALEFEGVPVQL
jgi:uncharacterized protein (DUF433 family)